MFSYLIRTAARRAPPLSPISQCSSITHPSSLLTADNNSNTNVTTNIIATTQKLNYSSFTIREVLHESSDEAGTLLTRFAKHIAFEVQNCISGVPTTIRYSDYFPITDDYYFRKELYKTSAEQLPALIIFASTYRPNANPEKFVLALNEIDKRCVQVLPQMSDDNILQTLYALLFLIPNWITRTDFYRNAISKSAANFTADSPKEKFVQLCFYLGLDKKNSSPEKNSHYLQQIMEQHLVNYLPKLTTMDLAIVSSAAYKTATAVQIPIYEQRLIDEVINLPVDNAHDALLVTFVKAMRFQRVHSIKVCERLTELLSSKFVLSQLQARGLVHIFAYFAENLYDKKKCYNILIDEFIKRLDQLLDRSINAEYMRAKDVGMFLWSCAQLNCTLKSDVMKRMEVFIEGKIRNNELRVFPDQLVDCCLSLWLLGHQSRSLLEQSLLLKTQTRNQFKQQQLQRDLPKVDSRLIVLLTAAAIEKPEWTKKFPNIGTPFDLSAPVYNYLMKGRDDLNKYMERFANDRNVANVKLVCPLNGINIPGILAKMKPPFGEDVYVELVTDEQKLLFSGEPVAILRLKIRLLNALGHKVVKIPAYEKVENSDYTFLTLLQSTELQPAEMKTLLASSSAS